MKKFLSLVLALIMAMSLVTISAGATEYEDLTDKDEIQYEEAVAVLNRLGIITGYSDGSFRPEGELTRGAAAKIITSLMIGPEAAENLTVSSAPYTDVPVDNNFAAVINYCKSAGYISGYGDGTFRPSGKLTGYAFGKMLLGALGYKSEVEGFEGAGWNMKVASVGNEAGLFDRVSFKGNEQITRQVACQLALNTLKGTLVEYSGGMNVSNGDQTIVVNPTRSYKVSNQEFASHINNKKADNSSNSDRDNWYTVEFGEEHFVDLRMVTERSAADDFGRPSNEWSYKKVTIGTYPVEPDYTYTTQVAHDVAEVSASTKTRALGLSGFKFDDATGIYLNGKDIKDQFKTDAGETDIEDVDISAIADYTDNGTLVEVYIDEYAADTVEAVVIIQTQLMEVKRIGSDFVTLSNIDPDNKGDAAKASGYNQEPIHVSVEDVEEDNGNYAFLSGLKAGDYVAVVPVSLSHDRTETDYKVANAYTPEEVTGRLTRASIYGKTEADRQAIGVTVGGTAYTVALWNKDLTSIKADDIQVTREDVKLYLDEYGNALRAKNVGETENFMIIKGYYSGLENGKLVRYVEGWDISGTELSLNIGSSDNTYNTYTTRYKPGDLVHYTNEGATGSAEWVLDETRVYNVDTSAHTGGLKASNVRVTLETAGKKYTANKMKFIYVTFDEDGDVDSIEVTTGMKTVSQADLQYTWDNRGGNWNPAQACLDDSSDDIEAIVVKKESNEAISSNMLYIRDYDSEDILDDDWGKIYGYTAAMMSKDGLDPKVTIYGNKNLKEGWFASYSAAEREGYNNFYNLKHHTATQKATSVVEANVWSIVNADRNLVRLTDYRTVDNNRTAAVTNIEGTWSAGLGIGDEANVVDMGRAEWLDLYKNGHINSVKDLRDYIINDANEDDYPVIKMIFNDDTGSDGFRMVSMVVVLGATADATNPGTGADMTDTDYVVKINGKTPAQCDATGTDEWMVYLGDGEEGGTLSIEPNSPYASVTIVSGDPKDLASDNRVCKFKLVAGDGTTDKTITVQIAAAVSDVLKKEYHVYYMGTPSSGSTSINVFFFEYTTHNMGGTPGDTGKWLTSQEIQALGLTADNFNLVVSGQTGGDADKNGTWTPKNVGSKVAFAYESVANTALHGHNNDWDNDNAGFIKLQFADDDGNPVAVEAENTGHGDQATVIGDCVLNITGDVITVRSWDWNVA